jgi:hypothetical protein
MTVKCEQRVASAEPNVADSNDIELTRSITSPPKGAEMPACGIEYGDLQPVFGYNPVSAAAIPFQASDLTGQLYGRGRPAESQYLCEFNPAGWA